MYQTAIKTIKQITDMGYKAYIVGGFPRDLYMKRNSTDIDICTSATPKQIKQIFKNVILPKDNYGSVTVVVNKIRFEITTFRKEFKYENNRQPVKVEYIDNLLDDLKRRDFTINTICLDQFGNMIDLLKGKEDVDNKIIRMVGDPKIKLKEDALRILRAIRFATVLNFEIDNDLKKYIKRHGKLLKKLSYYRKKEELEKIFLSQNIKYGINLIKELGLDKHLELSNIEKVNPTTSIEGIWAQLDVENIYAFSNHEKDTIIKIKQLMDKDLLDNTNLYEYGLYISAIVGEIKSFDRKVIVKKYNLLNIHNRNDIVLKTNHICQLLNKKPGPYLKHIISDIEKKLVNNELNNNMVDLEKYVLNNYYI